MCRYLYISVSRLNGTLYEYIGTCAVSMLNLLIEVMLYVSRQLLMKQNRRVLRQLRINRSLLRMLVENGIRIMR
jgi:hypothetical protein